MMYGVGSRGFNNLDPRWQEFAASLRKGNLYVKMPIAKARALCMVWHVIRERAYDEDSLVPTDAARSNLDALFKIVEEEAQGSQMYGIKSVFYSVPTDQALKDIEDLKIFVAGDATGVFRSFMEALEAGIKSDPAVDWIMRTGGPPAHPFEALQEETEPVLDLSLDDLFVDDV